MQMHYWPRWDVQENGYAIRLVKPCSDDEAARQQQRIHFSAEIVDFRVIKSGNKNANREMLRRFISADDKGEKSCSEGPASRQCLSCTRWMHAMCKCATLPPRPHGQIASPRFHAYEARACCEQMMHSGDEPASPRRHLA